MHWRLLAISMLIVLAIRTALWVLPSRVIIGFTRRAAAAPARSGRGTTLSPARIAWAVATASRHVPYASCLTQALATHLLLGWCGYESRMRLGVGRYVGGQFRAHMWVERDGQVLIGGDESRLLTPLEFADPVTSDSPLTPR